MSLIIGGGVTKAQFSSCINRIEKLEPTTFHKGGGGKGAEQDLPIVEVPSPPYFRHLRPTASTLLPFCFVIKVKLSASLHLQPQALSEAQ